MRLVVAECTVDYDGRLTPQLVETIRRTVVGRAEAGVTFVDGLGVGDVRDVAILIMVVVTPWGVNTDQADEPRGVNPQPTHLVCADHEGCAECGAPPNRLR